MEGVCDSIGLLSDGHAEAYKSVPKMGVCLGDKFYMVEVDSSSSHRPNGDFGMEQT